MSVLGVRGGEGQCNQGPGEARHGGEKAILPAQQSQELTNSPVLAFLVYLLEQYRPLSAQKKIFSFC